MKNMKHVDKSTKPATTRVNEALRKLGAPYRLVRGRGYYYVTEGVVSPGLYVCWLEPSDYVMARDYVNDVLRAEHALGHPLYQIPTEE